MSKKVQKTIVNWVCYFIQHINCLLVILLLFLCSLDFFFLKFSTKFNVFCIRKKFYNKNTAIFSHPFAVSLTLIILSVCVCLLFLFSSFFFEWWKSVFLFIWVIENKENNLIEYNKFADFGKSTSYEQCLYSNTVNRSNGDTSGGSALIILCVVVIE